ncbi:MAG: TolC family protein [Verrucomicrobia bacterium]|nr:TolC family protein [Verrucomicrobiota bacterium]
MYRQAGLWALLALAGGCASTAQHPRLPTPRPLAAHYESSLDREADAARTPPVEGLLTLDQALALALMHNPSLAAFAYDVRAAEALRLQAGRLINPQVELEIEEYDRDGAGIESSETVVGLTQWIELGGKRHWRTRVAEARGELKGWDYERQRLDVFSQTAQRVVGVIAAQRRLTLAESTVELAEQTNHAVTERVKAGKEPPLQASKAAAELEMVRLNALEATSGLELARLALAAMWGADEASFEAVAGDTDRTLDAVPALATLKSRLAMNPELARWDSEISLRQAALRSARTARVPDLKAALRYAQYEEDGTDAFSFGVTVKLPIFDRNQGGVAAAALALEQAEVEREATALQLGGALTEAHAALALAQQRVDALRTKVVPAMQSAFDGAAEGYRQGKFGFLEMLDAQRRLIETNERLLDAWRDHRSAQITINRIAGPAVEVDPLLEQEKH